MEFETLTPSRFCISNQTRQDWAWCWESLTKFLGPPGYMTNKCLQDFRLFKYPFKILYPNFLRHPVCGCQDFRMRHNQRKHCKQSLDHLDCYELSDILEREHLAQKRGETILCVMLVLSQVLSQLINTRFSTGSSFYHLMK